MSDHQFKVLLDAEAELIKLGQYPAAATVREVIEDAVHEAENQDDVKAPF